MRYIVDFGRQGNYHDHRSVANADTRGTPTFWSRVYISWRPVRASAWSQLTKRRLAQHGGHIVRRRIGVDECASYDDVAFTLNTTIWYWSKSGYQTFRPYCRSEAWLAQRRLVQQLVDADVPLMMSILLTEQH